MVAVDLAIAYSDVESGSSSSSSSNIALENDSKTSLDGAWIQKIQIGSFGFAVAF